MKIHCPCGEVIPDSSDDLPYKAYVLTERASYEVFQGIAAEMATFLAATTADERKQWTDHHLGPGWAPDLAAWEYLSTFVQERTMERTRLAYECETCGRLLIQPRRGDLHMVPYSPDQAGYHQVLDEPDGDGGSL